MRIAALTYNFGTPKIEQGMHHLALHGYAPKVVLAAPRVELSFYQSKIRVAPKDIPCTEPKKLAEHYDAQYYEYPHNSTLAENALKINDIDLAVILGARIIKRPLIDACKVGILNLHPGLLPQNRGLDNIKWAIILGMKQGATAHLIDERIDAGRLVCQREVKVYEDDTLIDLMIRVQAMERTLMVEAIDKMIEGYKPTRLPDATYRKAVPPDVESTLMDKFEEYKKA